MVNTELNSSLGEHMLKTSFWAHRRVIFISFTVMALGFSFGADYGMA
jgi:hypothetical protein